MLREVGAFLTQRLYTEHIIEEEDMEWYAYGIEITLSNTLNFLLMLIAGFLCKDVVGMLIYYFTFVSIRIYTGGFHASSYGKCMLIFFLLNLLSGGIKEFTIKYLSENYIKGLLAMSVMICGMCIFKFAPVEHENHPLTEGEKERYYKISLFLWGIWSVLGCIFYWCNIQSFSVMISLALVMISILIVIAKAEERRNGHVKGKMFSDNR